MCSFSLSVPAVEYHFFTEPSGTRAAGVPIAYDQAGSLHLYALNGASIVRDPIIDVSTLQLSNPPVLPKAADYLPQLAFTGPAPFAMDGKTILTYLKPEANALGQISGGAWAARHCLWRATLTRGVVPFRHRRVSVGHWRP